jgi:hypothetical protein
MATEHVDAHAAVFRAFDVTEFRPWPAWNRTQGILKANGGSYGVSGARGAGKSWLMTAAIESARANREGSWLGGIGLWYPSPSGASQF